MELYIINIKYPLQEYVTAQLLSTFDVLARCSTVNNNELRRLQQKNNFYFDNLQKFY